MIFLNFGDFFLILGLRRWLSRLSPFASG